MGKLSDRLRMHAHDCVRAADMDTDAVLSKLQIDDMADAMAEAATALEAAWEDAQRYRWLRENCGYSGSGPHTGAKVIVYYADAGDGHHGMAYTGPFTRVGIVALDDAIDSARNRRATA